MSENDEGNEGDGGSASWHESYEGETLGWIQNRGLDKLSSADALPKLVDGFRNAEKKIGVPSDRLLTLPADRTVEGSMDGVYNSLGRPEASDGYELTVEKDGDDQGLADWAKATFHKAGLSQKQAAEMFDGFKALTASTAEQKLTDTNTANSAADADLKREWGATYDKNIQIAQNAVKALGATLPDIDNLESVMGFPGVMKMFNTIGQKMGEDAFVSADNTSGVPGLPSTPQAATQRINELKQDKAFVTRKLAGDSEANALWTNLHKIKSA